MSIQYSESVLRTLARHLGVPASDIALTHDLRRDWRLTPLSLVTVMLDLERGVALELPPEGLIRVRTVADLVNEFRRWVQAGGGPTHARAQRRARASKKAQSERRLRRELHHLRWLEREWSTSNVHAIGPSRASNTLHTGATRRLASR